MIQTISQYITHGIMVIAMLILIVAFLGQIIHDIKALYRATFGEGCAKKRHKQK